jgi:small subunit ribosomal protein S35
MVLRLSCFQFLAKHGPPFANTSSTSTRSFATTSSVLARRVKAEEKLTSDQAFDILDDEFDDDDSASAGHLMLRQQRQVLYYLRLIEHEMPKLVGEFFFLYPIFQPHLA